jgi:hypothetical protein
VWEAGNIAHIAGHVFFTSRRLLNNGGVGEGREGDATVNGLWWKGEAGTDVGRQKEETGVDTSPLARVRWSSTATGKVTAAQAVDATR